MTEAVKATGAGLRNVVVGESQISSIDGARGILAYRGIDIHALAQQSTFEEVVFLLHRGVLPTRSELEAFRKNLAATRDVPEAIVEILRRLPPKTHPMTSLRTAVSALGAFEPEADNEDTPARQQEALRLTAQMATLVALVERVRSGQEPVAPRADLPHATNFLYMLRGVPPSASAARA